jgi:acetate kinase
MLNKHSGLVGISGESSDMREIEQAVSEGDKKATYAFNVFTYRIKKYIGAYASAMGGLDAVVFTGGIGENSVNVRRDVCDDMEFLGIKLDPELNQNPEGEAVISSKDSKIQVLRIPTNEELVIAMDTEQIVKNK